MLTKKILITGITGFIGRHLSEELIKQGYEVSGLIRYVSDRNKFELPKVPLYFGDILDYNYLREALKDIRPDIVIHLAMQSSVEYSFRNPYEEYRVGFLGTSNIAQAAMEVVPELEKFIFASSVEVYGNQKSFPIKEDAILKPASPYGVAKVSAEYLLRYLYESHNFPYMAFRSTNTYGRKFNCNFIVEHVISQMLKGTNRILLGNPNPIRDYLFVDDEVDAYIKLIQTNTFGGVFNTGTGRSITVKELVRIIGEILDYKGGIEWNRTYKRPYEIEDLSVDIGKIKTILGWSPKYSLESGLTQTIDWWRKYLENRKN